MRAKRKAERSLRRNHTDLPKKNVSGRLLLAMRTLSALTVVLRRAGLTLREIESISKAAVAAAATAPSKPATIPIAKDSALLGSALTVWHRDPAYVDRRGVPKPLPLYGRSQSVQALLRKAGLKTKSRQSADFLRAAGLLVRVARGKYLPTGRAARMPDLNAHFVEHIAMGVMKLIQTVHHNFTPAGKQTPLLQRAAAVRHLPRKHHADFREFIVEQGNAFVTNVDDWLESRATKRRKKAKTAAQAGVYAFAYLG